MSNTAASKINYATLNLMVKDKDVYAYYEDSLFSGYVKIPPPVSSSLDPWLCWNGPKITIAQWREALAFFAWTYKENKSESQVRLYYHPKEKKWRIWAFPQEKDTGMTTRELPELAENECKEAGLTDGWIVAGTIHHHCGASAWQSSIDKNNEETQQGLHITVGFMDKLQYDLHGRVLFKGQFYPLDGKGDIGWSEWFEQPKGLEALPSIFADEVMKHILSKAATDADKFPDEWKKNVVVVKKFTAREASDNWRNSHGSNGKATVVTQNGNGVFHENGENWTEEDSRLANACLEFDALSDECKLTIPDILVLLDTQLTPKPDKDDVEIVRKACKILSDNNITIDELETTYFYTSI